MMRRIIPAIIVVTCFVFNTKPLIAKENNSFINEIKDQIRSDNQLHKSFKDVTNQYGKPIWSQAFEMTFGQTNIAVTPLIDYANDYTSGIVVFLEDSNGNLQHEFISRESLLKVYANKKKSQKMKYRNSIIASFLKFDLKLYNIIERKLTQSIEMSNGNEEKEIVDYKIDESITALFN